MHPVVQKIIKNQKYQTVLIFSGLTIFITLWYFLFFQNTSKNFIESSISKDNISKDLKRFQDMNSKIPSMNLDWSSLNEEFSSVIDKIPNKKMIETVTDHLYSKIMRSGLMIIDYTPSSVAIEKKNIFLADLENEITVEKVPIDISLKGSFIDLNMLFEEMYNNRYRYTFSNIEVKQSKSTKTQDIKFIAYAYFQDPKNKINKNITKIQKNPPLLKSKVKKSSKNQLIPNPKISNEPDVDFSDIPEMWLEPATEPIDTAENLKESSKSVQNLTTSNELIEPTINNEKNNQNLTIEEPNTESSKKLYSEPYDIVVLQSMMCRAIKNNLPRNPGVKFKKDLEKIYCHSLLNNNTDKHSYIYHIWYMNGELKTKVLIRIPAGTEVPAISNQKMENLGKGKWRIEITDNNKKILDTLNFEVV